jgi:hypothetical protein
LKRPVLLKADATESRADTRRRHKQASVEFTLAITST